MQGPREDIIMRKLREPSISNKKSRTLIVFDGDYPVGWIARDENFFEVQHTCSWVKVHLTLICKQYLKQYLGRTSGRSVKAFWRMQ